MRRPLAVAVLAALPALALAGTAAEAQAPQAPPADAIKLTLSPDRPARGATLGADIDGTKLDQSAANQMPRSARIDAPRGLKVEPRAVAATCSAAQAKANECPAASRVGSGSAELTVTIFGFPSDVTAQLTGYLAPPRGSDLAGLVIQASAAGQRFAMTGRVTRGNSRRGPSLLFDGLDGAGALPSGVTAQLKRLTLAAGARRTVSRRVGKRTVRTRYDLLTTPPTCGATGTWNASGTVTFADGTALTVPVAIPCRG